jgi:hypothetical protein
MGRIIFTFACVMNKAPSIWHLLRLLIGCFLLLSFLSSSLHLSQHYKVTGSLFLVKKVKGSNQTDSETPYEEAEKEIESRIEEKSRDTGILLTFLDFSSAIHFQDHQPSYAFYVETFPGSSPGVPLYLSKRSLLI